MKRYLESLENIQRGDVFYSYLPVNITTVDGTKNILSSSHFLVLDKELLCPVSGSNQIDPHLQMLVLWGQTLGCICVSPGWLIELQSLNGEYVLFEPAE